MRTIAVDRAQLATTPVLLRATHGDEPGRAATTPQPRLVQRRTAVVLVAVLTPLAVVLGASAAHLTARASSTPTLRSAFAPVSAPTRNLGICASDVANLFATVARMPGVVAAEVVAHLSSEYADAIHSIAETTDGSLLPAVPEAPTLAHALARLGGSDRRAILSALPPEQQVAVNSALFDTALIFMTYGERPPCP